VDLPVGFLAGLAQGFEEEAPFVVALQDSLALVAAADDLPNGAGIRDSHFLAMRGRLARAGATCQNQDPLFDVPGW